jgi:hypothetical protein
MSAISEDIQREDFGVDEFGIRRRKWRRRSRYRDCKFLLQCQRGSAIGCPRLGFGGSDVGPHRGFEHKYRIMSALFMTARTAR